MPVSVAAYGFSKLVAWLQQQLLTELPEAFGFEAAPAWWLLPLLALSGLLVALATLHLPGTGGHSPADGFKAGGALPAEQLTGVVLAAVATLSFGVVLGPEAQLILMGSGLGVLAVRLAGPRSCCSKPRGSAARCSGWSSCRACSLPGSASRGSRSASATGHSASNVLFSGQDDLGPVDRGSGGLVGRGAGAARALQGLAYALALSSFRGGPVFPAMFIGAAAGMAAASLPGLELAPAIAMGMGAMCTVMLALALTVSLLATHLLGSDGLAAMPLVIVAVVVAYVVTARLTPAAVQATTTAGQPQPSPVRLVSAR